MPSSIGSTVRVDTTRGPKYVPKKFVDIVQAKQKAVTIKTKTGEVIPLLLESIPVVFKRKDSSKTLRNISKDKTFICEQCGKRFPNETRYKVHQRVHSVENVTCPTCKKVFKHTGTLQKHLLIHKGIRYTCELCGISMSTKDALASHIKRHNGTYVHKCTDCGKEYYNAKSFNHHVESEHTGIRYTCEICGSIMKSRRYFKDHMAIHKNKNARTFECNVCHKYYSTKSALNNHSRIHTGQHYICDVCGKKSIQKGAHDSHMRTHSGQKSYICQVCGKSFIRKDVLDLHVRRAHESSKIPCKICGVTLATDYQLKVHLHVHADIEKPFPCELCSERFINKNFLRHHVNRVHIENKPAKVDFVDDTAMKALHRDELAEYVVFEDLAYDGLMKIDEAPYANHEVVVEEFDCC